MAHAKISKMCHFLSVNLDKQYIREYNVNRS